MKKFILNNDGNYTTFLNPNPDLKTKIQNLKFDIKNFKFQYMWNPEELTVDTYEGDKIKCLSEKGIQYINKSYVDDMFKEYKLRTINQKYDVVDLFNKIYGVIYNNTYYKKKGEFNICVKNINLVSKRDLLGGDNFSGDPTDVNYYWGLNEFSVSLYDNKYASLSNSGNDCGQTMSIYFNENGDVCNRDYNEDIASYCQEKYNTEELIKYFDNFILNLEPMMFSKKTGLFYSDNYCYCPYLDYSSRTKNELRVDIIPKIKEDIYQDKTSYRNNSKYKKPKDLIEQTPEQVLTYIKSKATSEFYNFFTVK